MISMELPDQQPLWDAKHAKGDHAEFRDQRSALADVFDVYLPSESVVLDLGCGVGGDSAFLAESGHFVVATDFSSVVLGQNREKIEHPNIGFVRQDLAKPFPFVDEAFDGVFAHLSLHYFDDQTTHTLFKEIHRVIKPGGVLGFACKTPQDPEYGKGRELEPNLFVSEKNHVRHFFTETYIRALIKDLFEIKSVDEEAWDMRAHFIRSIVLKNE